MIFVVGLGNPGKEYEKTRHNIGQMALEKFAADFYFPKFKLDKLSLAYLSQKGDFLLVKPNVFMNESGISVNKLIKNKSQIPNCPSTQLPNLWVVHDDLDLDLGRIKISLNSTAGGHKGVQSIIDQLNSKNFIRFRLGIRDSKKNLIDAKNFVLKKFKRKEKKTVQQSLDLTSQALNLAQQEGITKVQSQYNS
ncbi:aminoacyl-tRNA hydrolase [Patescibacteria group bacterium]|nr:aminoacyl-tRNA hydrolase [Patescibacteria group bacterium]